MGVRGGSSPEESSSDADVFIRCRGRRVGSESGPATEPDDARVRILSDPGDLGLGDDRADIRGWRVGVGDVRGRTVGRIGVWCSCLSMKSVACG